MELLFAFSTREWDVLIAGILALVLAFVVIAYEDALRVVVASWLCVSGAAAIVWALAG